MRPREITVAVGRVRSVVSLCGWIACLWPRNITDGMEWNAEIRSAKLEFHQHSMIEQKCSAHPPNVSQRRSWPASVCVCNRYSARMDVLALEGEACQPVRDLSH